MTAPGDGNKIGARVALAGEADGEEQEGVDFLAFDLAGRLEEREGAASGSGDGAGNVVIGQLKEELELLPFVPAGMRFVELARWVEVGAESFFPR